MIFSFQDFLEAPKMGPIGCPETSVRKYDYSLRNNPEERSSHLLSRRKPEIKQMFTHNTNKDTSTHTLSNINVYEYTHTCTLTHNALFTNVKGVYFTLLQTGSSRNLNLAESLLQVSNARSTFQSHILRRVILGLRIGALPGCWKSGANCLAVALAMSESSRAWSAAMSASSALPRAVAVLRTRSKQLFKPAHTAESTVSPHRRVARKITIQGIVL